MGRSLTDRGSEARTIADYASWLDLSVPTSKMAAWNYSGFRYREKTAPRVILLILQLKGDGPVACPASSDLLPKI